MANMEHKAAMLESRERIESKTQIIRTKGAGCMVCREQIPHERERRGSVTCSNTCKEALRLRKLDNLKTQKCPHCNHPSSPDEWEEFKRWRRQSRTADPIARKRGNPHWEAKAKKLAATLKGVSDRLEAVLYNSTDGVKVEAIPEEFRGILGEISRSGFANMLPGAQNPVDESATE